MNVSVVVPTCNRGPKLAATLDRLLQSETSDLDEIEIIVVDDGSPVPAEPVVASRRAVSPFSLRCIRQSNGGGAAARNAGFRASRGRIVLFIDDDILVPPDLIRKHVEAHAACPGSVICGTCLAVDPDPPTPLFRFFQARRKPVPPVESFLPLTSVASGQMSVRREMFERQQGVYEEVLTTPGEDLVLSARLRGRGIRMIAAAHIVARHDHPFSLDALCRQQYKHALGCAEAAVKVPAVLDLPEAAAMMRAGGPPGSQDAAAPLLRKTVRSLLAKKPARTAVRQTVRLLERLLPSATLLGPLYRLLFGLYGCAGVRDGLRRFSAKGAAEEQFKGGSRLRAAKTGRSPSESRKSFPDSRKAPRPLSAADAEPTFSTDFRAREP